jgi:hypothetical protein
MGSIWAIMLEKISAEFLPTVHRWFSSWGLQDSRDG